MRARSVIRWFVWSVVGLLLLIALCVLLLLTEEVQTPIAKHFLKDFNKTIAGSIDFDRVHASLSGEIVLSGFSLRDSLDEEIAAFSKLRVVVDPYALLQDRIHIQRLKLSNLRANIVADSSGNSNIAAAFAGDAPADTTTAESSSTWRINLDVFEIVGDRTTFEYDGEAMLDLDEWNFRGSGSYAENRLNYEIDFNSDPLIHLDSKGSVAFDEELRDLQVRLSAQIDSAVLQPLPDPLPGLGSLNLQTTATIRSDSLNASFNLISTALGTVGGQASLVDFDTYFHGRGSLHFERLNLASFLDDSSETIVTGNLEFQKSRSEDYVNGWDAKLKLFDSRLMNESITSDLSIVTVDSTALVYGSLHSRGGSADLNIAVDGFDPAFMGVQGDLNFSAVDLRHFLPAIPDSLSELSGLLDFDFPSVNPDSLEGHAYLRLSPLALGNQSCDSAVVSIHVDRGSFEADTLMLSFGEMRIDGTVEGRLGDTLSFALQGGIPDLADVASIARSFDLELDTLGGALQLDLTGGASLRGDSLSALTAAGTVRVDSGRYGDYSADSVALEISAYAMDANKFDVLLRADGVHVAELILDSAVVTASGTPENLRAVISLWAMHDTLALETALDARISDASIDLTLDELTIMAYDTEWNLLYPTDVSLVDDKVELGGVIIRSPFGVLRAVGFVQAEGEQDLTLELSGFHTAEIARFFDAPIPGANVNIRLQITGPDTALSGDVTVHVDSLDYDGKPLADEFFFFASLAQDTAQIQGYSIWYGDTLTEFHGALSARMSFEEGFAILDTEPISGELTIFEQPMDRFNPWLVGGAKTGGVLSADMKIHGTPKDPQWEGSFSVRDGLYIDPQLGINYKWMVIDGQLFGDSLIVNQFRATSRGTLTGSGYVIMGLPLPERLDLDINFDKFTAMDSPQQKARLSGNLKIAGPFDSLDVGGELTMEEVVYRVSQSTTKNLEEIDLEAYLAELRGDSLADDGLLLSDLYAGMSHSIRIVVPGNCWIRGGGINIELYGDLWMYKEINQDPSINGDISVRRGTAKFVGREMQVEEGTVSFTGPIDDPEMDITAVDTKILRREGAEIRARLYGPVSNTRIEFSGRLADGTTLSQEEVVRALLLGTTKSGEAGNLDVSKSAAEIAASPLNQVVEQASGLDVFEFRPGEGGLNDLSSGSLEVGTYLTDRLFVRVLQPIETVQGGQEVSIEYQLREWLKLIAEQKGREKSAFDLFVQVEWR